MHEDDEDITFEPPSEERVRRRAWAISSVVCRAFIETFDDSAEAAALHARVLSWIDAMNLRPELEPEELRVIETEVGALDQQSVVNST